MSKVNDLKEALHILGLPEDATNEEVEKRYELLLRKSRARRSSDSADGSSSFDLQQINAAYKRYVEIMQESIKQEFNDQQYGKFKKWRPFIEKWDHFFSYYKFHVIISIVVIVVAYFGISGFLEKKAEREALAKLPLDLEITLFGKFHSEDKGALAESIVQLMDDWQRVTVEVSYVPDEVRSELDIAMQQKSVIALIAERPDIYIVDKRQFEILARQGAFKPLDDFAPMFEPYLTEHIALYGQTQDDDKPYLYGIDVSQSSAFDEMPLAGEEKVITIRMDSSREQKAAQLILKLLELVNKDQ